MSEHTTADLDRLHAKYEAMGSLLFARAREDLAGAVLPGQSYEASVSSSGENTATEQGLDRLSHAHTFKRIVGRMEKLIGELVTLHNDVTPTGAGCRSKARDDRNGQLVSCERMATVKGYCSKCWGHVRAGIAPDAELLREWNGRLERDCTCTAAACDHDPGGCLSRIPAGQQARQCDACRQRVSRARRQEPDGPHPWRWQDAS